MSSDAIEIIALNIEDFDAYLPALAEILQASVEAGAAVNFVKPFHYEESLAFWTRKVRPQVIADERIVLLALCEGQAAGTVQLEFATAPNQPHRAEVAKLLVHPNFRQRGIARRLMLALEDYAHRNTRSLLTLDTSSPQAEALYRALGYQPVGQIPDFALVADGDAFEPTLLMYKQIATPTLA